LALLPLPIPLFKNKKRAKANVPNAGWQKIELKKCAWAKNKKYKSVGSECRFTRCPVALSFV